MTTLKELETALLEADRKAQAGDEQAKLDAEVLSTEIVKQRVGPQKFMQFFQGANEQMRTFVEGPTKAASKLPPVHPVLQAAHALNDSGAIDWWKQNMEGPEPTTAGERIARGAGRGTVDALAFLVPQAQLAKSSSLVRPFLLKEGAKWTPEQLANAVRSPATPFRNIGQNVLEAFRASPEAVAAYEAVAGATSGAGAQAGVELSDSPAAPIIGGIAGGIAPVALAKAPAVSPTYHIAKRIWQMFTNPEEVTKRAKKSVYPYLERAISTPEAEKEFVRTQDVSKRLGLGGQTDFTIAQKTGSTQLLRDQMSLEASATGNSLDALAARKRNVITAISEKQDDISPKAIGDVAERAQIAGARRIEKTQSTIAAQQEVVQADMAAATAHIVPTDKAALGRGIRQSLEISKRATKERLSAVAKEAGLNEDDVNFDFGGLEQAVADRFSGPDFGNLAPKMVARLRAFARANKPDESALDINTYVAPDAEVSKFTLRDLQDIRTSIGDEITTIATSGAANRNQKLRELYALRKTVDNYIDTAAPVANPDNPDLAKNWASFRKQWREEYANVYEKGRVFKALRYGNRDIYKTTDEMVADSFMSPTGARQYLEAGGDPQALRSAALDNLSRVAIGPDGTVKVARLQAWMRANGRNLPESVRAEFGSTQKAVEALAQRQNTLYLREQRVNDSLLARSLGRSGKDPDKFIDAAMRDPGLMRQAITAASDTGSLEALRRAVWLRVFPDGEVDIRNIDRVMADNSRVLTELFGEKHLSYIKLIRDGLEIEGRTPFPQGAPARPEDFISRIGEQAGTGVPQMASRAFAVASGRTSLRFVMTEMMGRLFTAQSKKAQEEVFKEALTNPELARDLQLAMADKNALKNPELRARLNIWLWNLGIPHTEDAPE